MSQRRITVTAIKSTTEGGVSYEIPLDQAGNARYVGFEPPPDDTPDGEVEITLVLEDGAAPQTREERK